MSGVRKVAIAVIRRPLSELVAENKVYKKGQLIIAVDEDGKEGLKTGDWDFEASPDSSTGTPFNDRPWIVAPTSAASLAGFTPFKVRHSDDLQPKYEEIEGNVVITDTRLINASEAIVYSTVYNTEFRDSEMDLDSVAGTLTLLGFSLPAGEHISITVPALIRTADSAAALIPRLEKLEIYTKPIALGGAIYIWKKPANMIPEEFQEVTDLRGKFIVGYHPDDAEYNDVWTKTGGSKKHIVDATKNVKRFRLFTVVNQNYTGSGNPYSIGNIISGLRSMIKDYNKTDGGGKESFILAGSNTDNVEPTLSPTSWMGKEDVDIEHIDHRPEFRTVEFIELKPEYQIT